MSLSCRDIKDQGLGTCVLISAIPANKGDLGTARNLPISLCYGRRKEVGKVTVLPLEIELE